MHRQHLHVKIQVLHPQLQALEETQTAPIQQLGHQIIRIIRAYLLARLRLRPTSREGLRLITEVIYTSVIAVCLDGEVDLKSERQPEPLP